MSKKEIITAILALLLGSLVFFFDYQITYEPKELYRVYLSGRTLGYIESEEKLEQYIDEGQQELKEKYLVDKIYTPNDLDITREITYNKKISTEEEIYTAIKDITPFTVDGYIIEIKGIEVTTEEGGTYIEDNQSLYVLDKEKFENAVYGTIMAFTTEKEYNDFINNVQIEVKDTGKFIEDMYIKNKITIKQARISTAYNILVTEDEIAQYLLFGSSEEQKEYVVKEGDDIDTILNNNKLSLQEFLIANPEFSSASNLIYEGLKINIGLIQPLIKFYEESHVVEIQEKRYDTKIEYDSTLLTGVEHVKQKGISGTNRITKKVQMINGEIESAMIDQSLTEEIKPTVTEIIVKGNRKPEVGNLGIWYWPTAKPYVILSHYGWRWGKLHEGTDIGGTGYGSPIYAANNGVVTTSTFNSFNGNYVIINHNNGYYSLYAHLASLSVKAGQVVAMGDKIGTMGQTGNASGVHLHFSIFKGVPYMSGSSSINPMLVY